MPFTPYHFGPSGFAGLLFRRWVNVPVFIAANVLIDIEVLADRAIEKGNLADTGKKKTVKKKHGK